MPKQDFCNIRCARAEAKAEEKYWKIQEEADKDLRNKCTFCHQLGHLVYQFGVTCPKLKHTTCRKCGLLGHTPKFCNF